MLNLAVGGGTSGHLARAGVQAGRRLVEHQAAQLCERAVVLSRGRIVAHGPCDEVLADEATLAANDLELPLGFDLDRVVAYHRERRYA